MGSLRRRGAWAESRARGARVDCGSNGADAAPGAGQGTPRRRLRVPTVRGAPPTVRRHQLFASVKIQSIDQLLVGHGHDSNFVFPLNIAFPVHSSVPERDVKARAALAVWGGTASFQKSRGAPRHPGSGHPRGGRPLRPLRPSREGGGLSAGPGVRPAGSCWPPTPRLGRPHAFWEPTVRVRPWRLVTTPPGTRVHPLLQTPSRSDALPANTGVTRATGKRR